MDYEIDVMEGIGERIEAGGLDALTDAERYYFAIWWLESEANNGALEQFFRNPPGTLAHDALAGLRAVGAYRMAEIFQSAIELFPNAGVPEDLADRNHILDTFSPEQQHGLDQLSDAFTDYPDDLPALLSAYVDNHQQQFPGPTTFLELWQARSARGAKTQ
jgi:hypothetical protein